MLEKPIKESQLLVKTMIPLTEEILEIDGEIAKASDRTPDLWMQRSQAFAAQQMPREAIESLSRAIAIDPFSGILYRWRGHRYLNCGEVAEACADFVVASRLIPENWSVWYHLGLTYVLLGEYGLAENAYGKCRQLPMTTARKVALTNWEWITYRHMGKDDQAAMLLQEIDADMDAGANAAYLQACLIYKGELAPEDVLKEPADDTFSEAVAAMTTGFSIAQFYYLNGDIPQYKQTLDFILSVGEKEGWTCFGYAAARYRKENYPPEQSR